MVANTTTIAPGLSLPYSTAMYPDQAPLRHNGFEDAQAIVTATLFVVLGIAMYQQAGLLTGGTAGIAFLIHYATGWRFGPVFFVINLPFAWLAVRAMGWRFTLKSFSAVALLSVFSECVPLSCASTGCIPCMPA